MRSLWIGGGASKATVAEWLLYGANGYTGELIAREAGPGPVSRLAVRDGDSGLPLG